MTYYIIDVDEKNKLPTIPFSITAIENHPEELEKRKQNHCKTEQEVNNFMECTDEMDNNGSDCFGEGEDVNEEGNTMERRDCLI